MADFNPFDPRLRSDPYSVYRELREEDPVFWSPTMQLWLLTRYDDVLAVLRDHARFSSERVRAKNPFVQQMESFRMASGPLGTTPTMLSLDPPAHTRMRNLVNKAFTPRVVERSRPRIRAIAEELLDALPRPDRIDVVADLAIPLPVIVIAEVLGVPAADRDRFKAWSSDIAGSLGGAFMPKEAIDRALRSANEIADYFRDQIAERRRSPRDDLLSALCAAEEQGDLLSEDELIATCILLLVAGNETTTNLIGNGMLALLRFPEERRRLQQEPSLIPSAVEEMLRYEGPAQMTSRIALGEFEFQGKRFEEGQVVLCVLAAANRDPAQFPDPDRFDVTRRPNRHLAFGHGIHYCVGAPLAVAEAQVAFEALLRRFPEPEAAFEAPEWNNSFVLRGLRSLPMLNRRALVG
ncbi:MAG TPA: cytochrome P450 [Dehalococcoidia bacterium]|nr:cytochrome P450 [Dehalococcoidia bacterium]